MKSIFSRTLAAALAILAAAPASSQTPPPVRIANGEASSGWRDFVLHRDAMILMQGTLNGTPATIMIDSGVSAVIVDSAFARRAGLVLAGAADIHTVAGNTNGSHVRGLDVAVPGLTLSARPGFVVDLSPVHRVAGAAFDVMLGSDIFDAFMVDIDFPSRKIAFHDPRRFRPPASAVSVPLKRQGKTSLRSVQLVVEGKPLLATFDLGAKAALLLSPKFAAEQGLLDGRRRSTAPSTGVEGTSIATVLSLERLEFANTTHLRVPATIPAAWQNDRRAIPVPATVGMGLLGRFRLISDYSSDRLWLVPNEAALARPFGKERSGLHMVKSGALLKVIHVSAGSPAAAAGWRIGDEIAAVNGTAIADGYYQGDLHNWPIAPAGTVVQLRLSDGSTRSLTLQDYY